MNATHIVYTSETGFTARYAAMLSQHLQLPALTLDDALRQLPAGTPVIYMGWIMASSVKDLGKARSRFSVQAVVGVGLGDTGTQDEAVRKACKLPQDVPVFTVQGDMDLARLRGGYRIGIRLLTRMLAMSKRRTPGEDRMLALLQQGGDFVSEKELAAVLAWAEK